MQSNYNQCEHNLDWGETIYEPKGEFEFIFAYDIQESQNMLKVKVSIPLKTSVKELAHRLMTSHQIPCYIYDKIFHSLHAFVDEKTKQFNNDIKTNLFTSIEEPGSKEKLAKEWSKSHRGDKMVGGRVDINFNSSWSDIYHTLIHSPALDALLRLEYSYGLAMKEMVTKKDKALRELQEKQLLEMEVMVAQVGATKTDTDVNRLAANQLEESQMLEIYWSSALSDLQERQKREYRQWVLNVHEKSVAEESCDDMEHPLLVTRTPSLESLQMVSHFDSTHENIMEESFTVHLGTQMKTMHNIRLACRDMLDYCQCKISSVGGNMVPHPQRLQTAMALYSQSLSAMFLLVDDRFESLTGFKKEFVNICNETTDFHFPNYDKQICVIEQALQDRPVRKKSVRTSSFGGQTPQRKTNSLLQTGDFYITKHSNLAEVHAVFHLVTDESVTLSNINSRHPIMVGIRNIMLAAARHNITNIIIPLLLLHEMEENITVQWCMKRAELVLKCVKGFMMESLSWDGHESRTLQFVVPPGISEEMFIAFSNMLPSIFRVSNPLDLSNLSAKGDQG